MVGWFDWLVGLVGLIWLDGFDWFDLVGCLVVGGLVDWLADYLTG